MNKSIKKWLVKTEPSCWSWSDQEKNKVTPWDGVRNYQAMNNLKAMKIGDLALFYHSIKGKEIVGIVKVIKENYIDPTDEAKKFVAVDMEIVKAFTKPVTLEDIKKIPNLQHLPLLKQSRLSVMPIDDDAFDLILKMGQTSLS